MLGNSVFSLDLETCGRLYEFLHGFDTTDLITVNTACPNTSHTLADDIEQHLGMHQATIRSSRM